MSNMPDFEAGQLVNAVTQLKRRQEQKQGGILNGRQH